MLTNENKEDENSPKQGCWCGTIFSQSRLPIDDLNGPNEEPYVWNLLSKNQLDPTVNDFTAMKTPVEKCVVYRRIITEGLLAVGKRHIPKDYPDGHATNLSKAFARRYRYSLNEIRIWDFPLPFSQNPYESKFESTLSSLGTIVSQSSITVPPSPLIILELLSIVQKRVWLKNRGIDVRPSIVDDASLRREEVRRAGSVGGVAVLSKALSSRGRLIQGLHDELAFCA
ncbi:hypothetical protein V8G54_025187 [Vigna mungo]|uniref:Uncharacterized protein n=1 Tax=Vigna mungo TaxID=3915 RepID=A0AAQ3RU47_VIGMU